MSKYQNENDDPTIHNVFEVGKTYLILGNNNKFLSIINYGGTRGVNDYIESIKNQPDVFCRFVASTLYNGKIALRAVERNMYIYSYVGSTFKQLQVTLALRHSLRWKWEILSLKHIGLEHTMSTLRLTMGNTGVLRAIVIRWWQPMILRK